jgi:hypothetical protein
MVRWIRQPYQQQQGAGGIIQQRASKLIPAILDPSFYDSLSTEDKNRVETIAAAGALAASASDVSWIAQKLADLTYC